MATKEQKSGDSAGAEYRREKELEKIEFERTKKINRQWEEGERRQEEAQRRKQRPS